MRTDSAATSRNWAWLLPVAGLIAFLVLARVLVGVAFAGRIYPGVQVLGVNLGGQTVDQAVGTLDAHLHATDDPIAIHAGDQDLTMRPSELGFRPQSRTLARAAYEVGRTGGLPAVVAGPFLAPNLAPAILQDAMIDDAALTSAIQHVATQVDRSPRDATLTFEPSTQLQPSETGRTLDQSQARTAIRLYLLSSLTKSDAQPLALPVLTTQPAVTEAELDPLRARAEQLLSQPFVLTDGQQAWTVPTAMLRSGLLIQGTPPALDLKTDGFGGFLEDVARQFNRPARDAKLVITQGHILMDEDQAGQTLDQSATLAALRQAALAGQQSVPLTFVTIAPAIKAGDLAQIQKDAQALLDKGLVLTAQGSSYPIAPADLGDLLVVKLSGPGKASLSLDRAKVAAVIAQTNGKFRRPSPDARFDWENGQVKLLRPVVPGRAIDEKAATQTVLEKWRAGQVDLPVIDQPMTIDAAFLARLNRDLKGVIGSRSISYAGSIPERAHNINLALSKINGTLLMPGDTFSFNRQLGPTTLGAGFEWGFAYGSENGKSTVVPSVAGGICQVATSVFQPVFWAGYEIDERHWHMFPMKSYADKGYMGTDATVSPEDGLDLQFTNNTDHALLIKAWGDGAQTNVQLIGTKPNWTVRVDPEIISGITPAPTDVVRTTSPTFAAGRQIVLEVAQPGLTSHVTRHVVYPDGHDRTLNLISTYQPSHLSILVGTG